MGCGCGRNNTTQITITHAEKRTAVWPSASAREAPPAIHNMSRKAASAQKENLEDWSVRARWRGIRVPLDN